MKTSYKYLIIAAFALINICVSVWFLSNNRKEPEPEFKPIHTTEIVIDLTEKPPIVPLGLPKLAQEINEKNQKIKNVYCARAVIHTWDNHFGYRVSGTLAFEKPKKFYMTIRSILGDEINIGSNDEIFWYWSYRDIEPGVHWAKHEDFNKTRLKTPFDPTFLRGSLGLDELTTEGLVRIIDTNDTVMLIYKTTSSMNKPLTKHVYLDRKTKTVYYTDIIDGKNNHVSSYVKGFDANGLPKEISYFWQEERMTLNLKLNLKSNVKIGSKFWLLPTNGPKINMVD